MNNDGEYQVPQKPPCFSFSGSEVYLPVLIVPQFHSAPYGYPILPSGIDNFRGTVSSSSVVSACPCPPSFNNYFAPNESHNIQENLGRVKDDTSGCMEAFELGTSIHRVHGARIQMPKAKRFCSLMRGKSDDSQLRMYTESLTPITDDVSSLLVSIPLPSKNLKNFCNACPLKRQIFSSLKSSMSSFNEHFLNQMIGSSESAKESRITFAEAIDKGLGESLYKGLFKRSLLRVKGFVAEAIRRILKKSLSIDFEEFKAQIDLDKIVNSVVERKLRRSASHFVEHSSSYKFDILPAGEDIDTILKARDIIFKSEVVVLDFYSFYLISPFWRHFFTKSSFKLRDVSGPGEKFKKECVCTMKCRYSHCPYSQRVFVNFEKQRVRIQKISSKHTHTNEELIESFSLGYICSYIKFFVPISIDFTASRMRMLIENAICPKAIGNSSRLAALGFKSVPLGKFRGEILKVRKDTLNCEQGKVTLDTDNRSLQVG